MYVSESSVRVRKPIPVMVSVISSGRCWTIALVRTMSCSRNSAGMIFVSPKSTRAILAGCPGAPGITKRLPGCGSAWNTPCRRIIVLNRSMSVAATSAVSTPAAFSASTSLILMPSMKSIVSTRREERSQ